MVYHNKIHPVSLGSSQIQAVSLGFTELRFLSDSVHIQTLSDSLILAQIHADLLRFSHVRSTSFPFTPDSDPLRSSQIHSFSLRFTQTHPDFLRLVRSHLDFFRFAQIHPDSHQIQMNSDHLRFTHSLSDSRRPTQFYLDWLNAIKHFFKSTQSHSDSLTQRETGRVPDGKREKGRGTA